MKIKELKERLRKLAEGTYQRKKYKLKQIKDNLSDKKSLCCNEPIILLGSQNDDIGLCSKCKKFTIDSLKQNRLNNNRNQQFKKIAMDALYDFDKNKKEK